jgi:Cytochrome P460
MSGETLNVIVANPTMIEAYAPGHPGNGKPWPDGSKTAKIQYVPKKSTEAPFNVAIPDKLNDVAFMAKDSKRFADSGGWGYAIFLYDAASKTFRPATTADKPPQGNDAKCGFACHTVAKAKDYVFTAYGDR